MATPTPSTQFEYARAGVVTDADEASWHGEKTSNRS